jgi:PAS domain S-box-containing protein
MGESIASRDPDARPAVAGAKAWPGFSQERMAQLFRASMAHSAVAMSVLSLDHYYLQVNPPLCALLGYTEAELVGRSLASVTHPEDRERDRQILHRQIEGEPEPVHFEKRYVRKDGETVHVRVTPYPVLDDQGRPWCFLSQVEDLAESRRAEGALLASELFYRDLLERQGEGFGLVDAEDRFLFSNPVGDRIFGVKDTGLAGRSLLDFLEPDQAQVVRMQTEHHLAGQSSTYELRIRRESGEHRYLQVTVTPRFTEGPGPVALISVFRDITERKLAEAAICASELKFATAFMASPDALAIGRVVDGRLLQVNEGFTQLFGWSQEEAQGRSILPGDLGMWARVDDWEGLLARVRAEGRASEQESVLRRRDGTFLLGLLSATPMDLQGEGCLLLLARDVTERRRAEEEKARLQAELIQMQKMESLGSLAGGVAHDMNNLLGAILGLASARMETEPPESPAYRAFSTITRAAQRGGELVKSLLSFARRSPGVAEDLDLNRLVEEQVQLLERTTLARVDLRMDLDPNLPSIQGDSGALAHAIMNLCINALEAMPGGGTLALGTRRTGVGWVELFVEDSGHGMPPEVLDRAADPFFTTKPPGKGTGLGLAMVFSTVQGHGGRMEITSRPGEGTRVLVRLPRHRTAS